MPQFSVVILLGLVGGSLVAATPFDQEKQNRDAECDNGCFFGSFPGGSCTNDAACMCTQQKYRERFDPAPDLGVRGPEYAIHFRH
ncbi:hypothetical protein K4K51_004275 [Colletotrichum sp. SAR 10_75]|nr:hypothetical protein K4K51_004275 [Colletotrichum sp. SAR 10_75]